MATQVDAHLSQSAFAGFKVSLWVAIAALPWSDVTDLSAELPA